MAWLTNPYRFGPPVQPVEEARYWAIMPHSADFGGVVLARIEMAASPGGANLCGSGTPGATVTSQGTVTKLFHGGIGTDWGANLVNGNLITYDFGTHVLLEEVRVQCAGFTSQGPNALTIFRSSDGVTWQPCSVHIEISWTASGQTKAFAVGSTVIADTLENARFWGIDVLSLVGGSGQDGTLSAMEFAESGGGANICVNGSPFSTSSWGDQPWNAKMLFDNNNATFLAFHGTYKIGRCGYIFPAGALPVELRLRQRTDSSNQAPAAFDVIWSVDGMHWHVTDSYSTPSGWSNAFRVFSVTP